MTNEIKFNNILPYLYSEAKNSPLASQLAAVLIKNGKMVSQPSMNNLRSTFRGKPYGSIHAEMNAIISYYGKDISSIPHRRDMKSTKRRNFKKLDLLVIRINNNNEICISRPCYNCLNMMKLVNIRRVYYVDNNNNIIHENVKDMISIHSSLTSRWIYTLTHHIEYATGCDQIVYNNILKLFPSKIKRENLNIFISHDFENLHNYSYSIENNIVRIFNSNKNIVITSVIID
jgi:deoxycytidylate deaminase